MSSDYFHLLNILGAAFFAVSGTLMGHEKKINGFGVFVVASMTALGGGTVRDVMLNTEIFWVERPDYLYATYGAIIVAVLFIRYLPSISNSYFLLVDAIGLALYNIVGIEQALIEGTSMVVAITMGMTTGIFGGLMRDVICREVPLVMRGHLYATACLSGGLAYAVLFALDVSYIWCIVGSVVVTLLLRLAAFRFGWRPNLFGKGRFF